MTLPPLEKAEAALVNAALSRQEVLDQLATMTGEEFVRRFGEANQRLSEHCALVKKLRSKQREYERYGR